MNNNRGEQSPHNTIQIMEKYNFKESHSIRYVGKVVSFYSKDGDASQGIIVVDTINGIRSIVGRYKQLQGTISLQKEDGKEWDYRYKDFESSAPVVALYF